jgi:hypothetical protein
MTPVSQRSEHPRDGGRVKKASIQRVPHYAPGFTHAKINCVTIQILLGTCAFTATGWNGGFYLRGMKSADYLSFYSE